MSVPPLFTTPPAPRRRKRLNPDKLLARAVLYGLAVIGFVHFLKFFIHEITR